MWGKDGRIFSPWNIWSFSRALTVICPKTPLLCSHCLSQGGRAQGEIPACRGTAQQSSFTSAHCWIYPRTGILRTPDLWGRQKMVSAKWGFSALALIRCEEFSSPEAPPGLAWKVRKMQPSLGIPLIRISLGEAWQPETQKLLGPVNLCCSLRAFSN